MTSSTIATKDFEPTNNPSEVLKPTENLGQRMHTIYFPRNVFLTDKDFLSPLQSRLQLTRIWLVRL